jgi:hypothetical protein
MHMTDTLDQSGVQQLSNRALSMFNEAYDYLQSLANDAASVCILYAQHKLHCYLRTLLNEQGANCSRGACGLGPLPLLLLLR